jgi:hypothetical protein
MAVKRESWSNHNPVQASSEEGLEKAEQLAPLEEQERAGKPSHQLTSSEGVINVDTGSLKLPSELTEKDEGKSGLFGLEPVTIVILVFALAFIAFITYLISIEPTTVKDEPNPAAVSQP